MVSGGHALTMHGAASTTTASNSDGFMQPPVGHPRAREPARIAAQERRGERRPPRSASQSTGRSALPDERKGQLLDVAVGNVVAQHAVRIWPFAIGFHCGAERV